jgi:hypothetical protein
MHERAAGVVTGRPEWQCVDQQERQVAQTDLRFAEKLYQMLDLQCGTIQERYARSERLMELDATRTTIGADLPHEADLAYAARRLRFFQDADRAGQIDLAGAALAPQGLVNTLLSAAKGAKQGPDGPMPLGAYRQGLREVADVAAAAVRRC